MPWEGAARQLDSRTFLQVLLPETLSFYYRSKPHDRHCRRNPGSHDRFTSFPRSVVAGQEERWQQPVRGAAQAKAPGQYARFAVADGRQWARRADKAADDHSDRAPVAAVPHRAPNSHRNSVPRRPSPTGTSASARIYRRTPTEKHQHTDAGGCRRTLHVSFRAHIQAIGRRDAPPVSAAIKVEAGTGTPCQYGVAAIANRHCGRVFGSKPLRAALSRVRGSDAASISMVHAIGGNARSPQMSFSAAQPRPACRYLGDFPASRMRLIGLAA